MLHRLVVKQLCKFWHEEIVDDAYVTACQPLIEIQKKTLVEPPVSEQVQVFMGEVPRRWQLWCRTMTVMTIKVTEVIKVIKNMDDDAVMVVVVIVV
ncbi:unnamed protein product [Prorocentrum cordatum]|uniref:Uncharacterized protein n=1 Tax=Prorocentrum cordatum TaxID=2364126 RepID=A0ABN9VUU9_9DINO|nr:unnamed protein product [Polarella glacialis]